MIALVRLPSFRTVLATANSPCPEACRTNNLEELRTAVAKYHRWK